MYKTVIYIFKLRTSVNLIGCRIYKLYANYALGGVSRLRSKLQHPKRPSTTKFLDINHAARWPHP